MKRENIAQVTGVFCAACKWSQLAAEKPIPATLFECPNCGEWLEAEVDPTKPESRQTLVTPDYFRRLAAEVPNVGFAKDLRAFANYLDRNKEILEKVDL